MSTMTGTRFRMREQENRSTRGAPAPQELAFRRGTKADARNENTSLPRWLVPVLRACRMPHSGRESDDRSDSTSLAKLMVSPASTGLIHRNLQNPADGARTPISSHP